jgi:ParB/RepB/Spo0J family partition protein
MTTTTKIKLADLHDSPSNPRKHYDEAALAELAADIKHHGRVLQPIMVRPRVPALFANAGDPDAQCGFEIVFGHRRTRAAELAGLDEIEAMVTSMTDEEVARAQISENLARQDVHPIEEAEGFQALMQLHGISADDLVRQTGKSRTYIYGRLKLLKAAPEVRDACLAGEIGSEVALLIARVGGHPTQQDALDFLKKVNADPAEGGKAGYRRIKELLADRYTLDLDDAIFDIHSTTLHAKAGACTACPKRVGQDPAFDDIDGPKPDRYKGEDRGSRTGACTDPDCFAVKKAQHLRDVATDLVEAGHTVMPEKATRSAFDAYGNLKRDKYTKVTPELEAKAQALGIKPVTIINPKDGSQLKVINTANAEKINPPAANPTGGYASPRPQEERAALAAAESTARKERLFSLRVALQLSHRTLAEARFVAAAMVQAADWHTEAAADLVDTWGLNDMDTMDIPGSVLPALEKLTGDELARLMLHLACITMDIDVSEYGFYEKGSESDPNDILDGLAKLHGIPTEKPSEPLPPAARALDKGAAKANGRAVAYRCPDSGQAWSGRGLKPKWLQVALANGKTLADFEVPKTDGPAALAPVGADGDGQAAAQGDTDPVLGSAEQGLVEGTDAQGVDAGATAEA